MSLDDGLRISRNHLPRWELPGSTYNVNWRLEAGLPPLQPAERSLMAETLLRFHCERYFLYAWVVMDDHVHAICQPGPAIELGSILHSWKSFTANRMQRLFGRVGTVWQKDSFTRILRSEADLREKMQYILNNPQRRWPGLTRYEWCGWDWPR